MKKLFLSCLIIVIAVLYAAPFASAQEDTQVGRNSSCDNPQRDDILIYPSCNLILHKESDNRTYRTTFAVWERKDDSQADQITWQFVRENLKQVTDKSTPAYILGSNLNIDLNVSDDAILNVSDDEERDAESPFPWRFNITLTIPPDVIYPEGDYRGRLLLFYNTDSDPIEIFLSLNYSPSRVLEIESPLPIRINSRLGATVNYPLVIHETSGAIEPAEVKVAPFYARGVEDSANFLPTSILANTSPITISNGEQKNIDLTFNFKDDVSAGAFSGLVVLSSENSNDLNIPVELSLKRSWIWPSIVLFGSILIGFTINFYNTGRQERDELLTQINWEIAKLNNPSEDGSERAEFKAIYGQTIERLLSWAKEELDKENPDVELAKIHLGELDQLYAFSRTERGQFRDLLNLRRKIKLLTDHKEEYARLNPFPYLTSYFDNTLIQFRQELAECFDQESISKFKKKIETEKTNLTLFT
ncbi:MAG: hypothetical protein AAF633_13510, partial [Chloroflexota bacterium]